MLNSCKVRRNTRTREIDQVVIDRPFTDERANVIYNYYRSVGIPIHLGKQVMREELKKRGYNVDLEVAAWHGSPHSFDRFSTEFMGTGEGAQAFGWGLYFTDLEGIARGYAKSLKNLNYDVGFTVGDDLYSTKIEPIYNEDGLRTGGYLTYFKNKKEISEVEYDHNFELSKTNIYKVSLHKGKQPSEYTWLEWDKPVTESQQKQLEKLADEEGLTELQRALKYGRVLSHGKYYNVDGKLVYYALKTDLGSPKAASLFLLENGIDGIKYPAESLSHGATSDTARGFNYVVFDENAITIEEHVQFLSTPKGEVYGFVTPEGEMFLDPDIAGVNTLIHEGAHIQYKVLKTAAERGDVKAQAILNKIQELTAPAVEVIFNAKKSQARGSDSMSFVDMQVRRRGSTRKLVVFTKSHLEKGNLQKAKAALESYTGRTLPLSPTFEELESIVTEIENREELDNLPYNLIEEDYGVSERDIRDVFDLYSKKYDKEINSYEEVGETRIQEVTLPKGLLNVTSSPAYNQRENETDAQYKERLREEVFARALGDNGEQYLKDLGFTKEEAKTFLQKVQEFLAEIVDWLRGKKGLQDLSVDEINKLSIREFLDRSTTSMMLGEFGSNPLGQAEGVYGEVVQNDPQKIRGLRQVVGNIIRNAARRLGISVEEYNNRHRVLYEAQTVSNRQALELFNLTFQESHNDFSGEAETLNQPNTDLTKVFSNNPKIKMLGLSENNQEHQWIANYLTTTGRGKKLLGRVGKNPTYEDIIRLLNEEFKETGERIKYGTDYYITDISDTYIDNQIAKAKAEANSYNESMWKDVKRDKQKYITEQQNLQRTNLTSIYLYYETAHEYPLAMKLSILDSILNNEFSYNAEKDKISRRPRTNTTISPHFTPNSVFMNKVIPHALSSKNIIHDYYYEATNFKGEKIDLSEYKDNIHSQTNRGTWYKFSQETPGDNEKFYRMSSLSSLYPGAWCTGGSQDTADNYLREGDLYIFYSNEENNPTLQLHIDSSNEALEVGGLLQGQGIREQDFQDLDAYENSNPQFNLRDVQEYTQYSKVLLKWNKNNRDNSALTLEEKRVLYKAKKYYKDKTTNLKDFRNSLSKKDIAEIYDVSEDLVIDEVINLNNIEILTNAKEGTIFTKRVNLSGEKIPENFTIPKGITLVEDVSLDSAEISGDFTIVEGVSFGGYVNLDNTNISGNLAISEGVTFEGGFSLFYSSLLGNFTIAEGVTLRGGSSFGRVKISGNFTIAEDVTFEGGFSLFASDISKDFTIAEGASFRGYVDFSNTKITGNFTIAEGASFRGYVDFSNTILPKGYSIGTDGNILSITYPNNEVIQYPTNTRQPEALQQDNRGVIVRQNGRSLTIFNKNSDITTIIHEKAHEYEEVLTQQEIRVLEEWSGYKKGTVEFSEAFAKGAEKVLYDGVFGNTEVNNIFVRFAQWFRSVIENAVSYFSNINEMNQDVLDIYANMMAKTQTEVPTQDGFYNESDFNPDGTVKESVLQEIAEERRQIEEEAKANGTWMKALNGNPTNLNEEQWVTVRTRRFKNWFGDWLNDPENASKVVDENGEPLVVYHGTDAEFTEFLLRGRRIPALGLGFYFTPNINKAKDYGGNIMDVFLNIKNPLDWRKLSEEERLKIIERLNDIVPNDAKIYGKVNSIPVSREELRNNYKEIYERIEEARKKGGDIFKNDDGSFEIRWRELGIDDANDYQLLGLAQKYDNNIGEILGYDAVTFMDETVVFNPNQIKSATDNVGTFSTESDNINFHIIGEQGATALDKAQESSHRLDNLAIAREMETSGKTPKEIRLATGWERGADGLWRYEIPDLELKVSETKSGVLESIVDAEELFNSYPKLRGIDTDLNINESNGDRGYYYPIQYVMYGSPLPEKIKVEAKTIESAQSILLHEVQHAIQEIEGFVSGGNPQIASGLSQVGINEILEIERAIEEAQAKKNSGEPLYESSTLSDIIESSTRISEYLKGRAKSIVEQGDEGISKFLFETPYNKYLRLAGEVEARNVQTRMNMTPEQRRGTLLQETEDVAREDQIIIQEGLIGSSQYLSTSNTLNYNGSTLHYKQRVNPITNQPTNQIEIELVSVPQENRNQGHARELLRQITEIADSRGQELYLFAAPRDSSTTTEGLIRLYKEFGFESTSEFLPEEMVRPARRITPRAEEILTTPETLLTEDIHGVQEFLNANQVITYYSEVGEINYKKNADGTLTQLKTVATTPQQQESITYQQLLSIPNLSKEQALEAYKNLYSTKFYDWSNKTNEC